MRATSKLLALAFTAALQPAMAGVVSLNFEDLVGSNPPFDISQLGNYDGVKFTGNAWGLTSVACNGFGAFVRTGSCGALELAQDALGNPGLGNSSFTLDLTGGFINEFSFYYSARSNAAVQIQLFDGAGGTGNVLATLSGLTGSNCANPDHPEYRFCDWTSTTMKFDHTALSLKVSGLDQSLMLDDLQFTTPGGGTVPEPASMALALGALGAAGWTRRRSAR